VSRICAPARAKAFMSISMWGGIVPRAVGTNRWVWDGVENECEKPAGCARPRPAAVARWFAFAMQGGKLSAARAGC
jgi:hypothetical protein